MSDYNDPHRRTSSHYEGRRVAPSGRHDTRQSRPSGERPSQSAHRDPRPPHPTGSGGGDGGRSMPRRRTKKRPIIVTLFLRLFQILGTLLLVGVVTGSFLLCYAAFYIKTAVMPHTDLDLSAYSLNENSKIYYTDPDTGLYKEMVTLVGEKDSELVSLDQIPQDLQDAVVAIEDRRFRSHHGVDWYRTAGAMVNMFLGMRNNFGGSTITQQLIKNVTQYDDVTVNRKITEIFTALELEKKYEKDDILELYLNQIYMGSRCFGVQAASQKYFGKDVSELSLAECASLAGITNNPSLYSPNSSLRVTRYKCSQCKEYTNNSKPSQCPDCGARNSFGEPEIWTSRDYNKQRQEIILYEMRDPEGKNGISYITQAEYEQALAEPLVFVDTGEEDDDGEGDTAGPSAYSWYVETVINEVMDDLQENTGLDRRAVKQLLYGGGLSIYTNYDPRVQAKVDEVYSDPGNLDNKVSKRGQKIKSAITVVDNSTGYVVAIAGDVGEKTVTLGNNYATMPHQPGSSFKPLSVYAPGLDMGLITPGSTLDDSPVKEMNGSPWPRNENNPYSGLISVQTGVMKSLNTIAVRTLEKVTPEASFQFLEDRFHITTLTEGYTNRKGEWKSDIDYSPLALGALTFGISTFEAAGAFATFPRNGTFTEPTTYLRIEDRNHNIVLDNTPQSKQVIQEKTAYYMNTMLTAAVQGGTGRPARISGMTVAGKTGTTQNSFARWFSGYTPYYTASVWVGYQYDEDVGKFSENPAVRMWRKVMTGIHENLENKSFPQTVETVSRRVCTDCGNLATSACEADIRGSRVKSFEFVKGDEPSESCSCHVPVSFCTGGSVEPVYDEEGNLVEGETTGSHHYEPGPFCPAETRRTAYLVDWTRDTFGASVGDSSALLSNFRMEGTCPVHTSDPSIPSEEPSGEIPSEWPSDWPSGEVPSELPSDWPSSEPTESPGWSWPWGETEPSDEPSMSLPVVDPGVETPSPNLPPEPASVPPEVSPMVEQPPQPTVD